jgi:hypothetical protein
VLAQFLKVFADIVLWRRGPQDLPASRLLLGLVAAVYVAVSVLQMVLFAPADTAGAWFIIVVLDPLLLVGGTYLLLRLFNHPERFLQTTTAILGTGALLSVVLSMPIDAWISRGNVPANSVAAGLSQLALVVIGALVMGRILQQASGSNLLTGVALSLTYFLVIVLLAGLVGGGGN